MQLATLDSPFVNWAPYPAPAALVAHCRRAAPRKMDGASLPGTHDAGDMAELLTWMAEREMFEAYDDWIRAGMALKTSFGPTGESLWDLTHDGSVSPGLAASKWESFNGSEVTLLSLLIRAKDAGWTSTVRKSTQAMFQGVAAAAGASLPSAEEMARFKEEVDAGRTPRPGPYEEDEEATPSTGLRDRRINAASLEGKPVLDREWLVRDLIPAKNVTLLYGDGGTGKSLLALQLATAVVAGKPFFGHAVTQGRVEFITAEDSHEEMHRRLFDVSRASGVPLIELSGLHLTSLADADAMLAVADSRSGEMAFTALYHELESVIAETRPGCVFLDTLADVFGGNEIIRAQARQFIGMLRRLCLCYDCTIVVLAHPSLAGMDKGTSGSTGWSNSVRSRLYLTRDHENDGREADENARTLTVGKSNYGRVGLEIPMRWHAGVFVSTGGNGGDPMVSAVKAERVFLELLAQFAKQNRYVSISPGKSYAPHIFGSDAAKQGINRSALKEAMERLMNRGRIENAPHGAPSKKMFRLYAIDLPTPASAC